MVVGVCRLDLFIPAARSLKDKRQVLRSLIDRLRSHFSASICEAGAQEKWQRARIGIALVGNSHSQLRSQLDKMVARVVASPEVELLSQSVEILDYPDDSTFGAEAAFSCFEGGEG